MNLAIWFSNASLIHYVSTNEILAATVFAASDLNRHRFLRSYLSAMSLVLVLIEKTVFETFSTISNVVKNTLLRSYFQFSSRCLEMFLSAIFLVWGLPLATCRTFLGRYTVESLFSLPPRGMKIGLQNLRGSVIEDKFVSTPL